MYYTSFDPFTKEAVYVAHNLKDRTLQRTPMQCFKPENYVETALTHRVDSERRMPTMSAEKDALMPLCDHFREPLAGRHHFTALHSTWATYLAEDLNALLPAGYFAEPNVQFGIEIDVAAREQPGRPPQQGVPSASTWAPPAPQLRVPFTIVTDVVEVQVVRNEGGPLLAGAVELISPANKDRPASREAFVSKCAAYLQHGAGLAIVDIVTERPANLHGQLLTRLAPGSAGAEAELYAAAYRPVRDNGQTVLEAWHEALALGSALPTMPLWLRGGLCLPLRLELAYARAAQMLRLPVNGA